jgi:hypothetical protein
MFDRIKKFFNGDEPQEQLVAGPPSLFVLAVHGKDFKHSYEDLVNYEYTTNKKGCLNLTLNPVNEKYEKHILYAPGYWQVVVGQAQDIKNPDVDQIKVAWESPTAGFPSLDDK